MTPPPDPSRAEAGGALRGLFPPDAVVVVASDDMWSAALHPQEEVSIVDVGAQRAREFRAGRACARQALERLGISDHPLVASAEGLPLWPRGVTGSISHCAHLCVCVVAPTGTHLAGLGIDVEEDAPMDPLTMDLVCRGTERARLDAQDGGAGQWAMLAFSAKESAFKCYYALTGTFLEFDDLELELEPDEKTFSVRLAHDHLPAAVGHRRLDGRFDVRGGHIYTGVTVAAGTGS